MTPTAPVERSRSSRTSATLDGRRVLLRADFNVPIARRRDHRRPAHPRRAAHHRVAAGAGRDGHGLHPPRPAEGRARPEVLGRARSGPGWPSWPRASSCSRTCASTRARRPTTRPSCRRSIDGQDALRQRRLRRVAPGPRLDRRARRSSCRRRAGRLLAREVEVLLAAARATRSARSSSILGGAKVSDKLGVIEALLEVADPLIIGGGMCFTFLAAQGHPVGDSLLRGRPGRDVQARCSTRARRSTIPHDITALGPGRQDRRSRRRGRGAPDRRRPARRLDGPRHRSRHRGRVRRRHRRGPHRLLERPDGRVRGSPLRGRHPHGGRGRGRQPRASPSSAAATAPRPLAAVRPRRPTSTTSRPAAARRSSCSSRATCPASRRCEEHPMPDDARASRSSAATGRCTTTTSRRSATLQKLRYLLDQGRPRRTSTSRCTRRSPTSARCRPSSSPRRSTIALGAQNCHWEEKGAFTGEVSPAFLAKLNVALRDRRPLRAPRAVRRDRREGEPARCRPSSSTA